VGRVRSEGHSRCIDDDAGLVWQSHFNTSFGSERQSKLGESFSTTASGCDSTGIAAGLALAGGAAHKSDIAT